MAIHPQRALKIFKHQVTFSGRFPYGDTEDMKQKKHRETLPTGSVVLKGAQ